MSDKKPVIFISYARKDEPDKPKRGEVQWRTYVQSYLAPAGLNGIVHIWVDEGIRGGDKWKKEIETQLKTCDLFILLVSISSLASDVVVNFEIKTIQARQAKGENVHIFPIVLEPFPKKAAPWLMELNLRPKAGKPLSEFSMKARKSEMAMIADEVVEILAQVMTEKKTTRLSPPVMDSKKAQVVFEASTRRVIIDIAHLPETAYERLVGRKTELRRLDDAWTDGETNILSLIAEGGAGKSALVNEWLKILQAENYRSAEAVLGWSFYSQGTKERATSAEQFLNWAIDELSIEIETTSAVAKGEAIAEAMATRRILLVLDGCEPLQYGLDSQLGELKDQGLRALLRRFAAIPPAKAHGLVVLTSRLSVRDIARWKDSAAPIIEIDKLSDEAGAALLRDNGVWGTDKELQAATREFGGHPLALGLLASLLKQTQRGDVRRRDHVRALLKDTDDPRHGHAKRVMASYETEWLARQPALLATMHMVGLFDRPATGDCLQALRKEPAIPGFTDALIALGEDEWQRAVARLREARLLAPMDPSAPDALDTHPLIREWFGERIKQTNEFAWKAAHGRLFEHLRDTTKEGLTPTLEDLTPLYQAVAHGCRAGRYTEALDDIFTDRICRRLTDGTVEFYTIHKLGSPGSDLAAISWFFEKPYDKPVAVLEASDQSWILNNAAYILSTQGRFADALPAMRTALRMAEAASKWRHAAAYASNLADSELIVGRIDAAVAMAKESVVHADRSQDKFEMLSKRAAQAATLHAAGLREEAERTLIEAERQQNEWEPSYPLLYSWSGLQYCDLLLAKGEWVAARERATTTLVIAQRNAWLLDIALDTVSLCRADLGLILENIRSHRTSTAWEGARATQERLAKVIDSLLAGGQINHLPRGLLARAVFRRNVGDWDGATRDLDEVEEIAEPGPMKLFLCDMALERARLAFAKIETFALLNGLIDDSPPKLAEPDAAEAKSLKREAAKQLAIANDYIRTCGYHRRDEELAELQAVLHGERKFADLPPRV